MRRVRKRVEARGGRFETKEKGENQEKSGEVLMDHRRQESDSPSAPLPVITRQTSPNCFASCFGGGAGDGNSPASPFRSPTSWFRSKANELPEIRGKCRSFISHIGRRRHHSADFRYDPLSYALNFDDGASDDSPASSADDLRHRGFSARLPASPPSSRIPPIQP
ncbi:hypothetical protein AXF42_Ash021229 [Apostasia shenzhenica]|uniref:Uncharacterized protein n=1 Tax=Apostasia shenzhenica TaxID=1088818 RepID=A0A2I0A592_9ASPA|nr:hypothetical protein AXF42_Ash021229 [Apostasia shenzhenica]